MTRPRADGMACALAVAAAAAVIVTAPSAQQPPQPTFRTGVTIVPVDVRVLDRDGKPITDLDQSDFTVLEDGAPQEIRCFSARGLVPIPPPASGTCSATSRRIRGSTGATAGSRCA